MRGSFYLQALTLAGGAALLYACTVTQGADPVPARDDDQTAAPGAPDSSPLVPTLINEDSGVFGASEHPSSSGFVSSRDAGGTPIRSFCSGDLGPGDLAVVEIMIASRSGSGDSGEWVEVQSTRDCWLHVDGVTVASPRGSLSADSVTVNGLDLAPGGTFVVADALDPTANHGITGTVYAWNATDVLKNDGDTVVLTGAGGEIDRVTYPAFTNLPVGRSLAFPVDCAASDRGDWTRWSLSFHAYASAFEGTPNGPNTDVACF